MVGIVVVSHSKKLAHEIIELCNEMKKYDFEVINGSGVEGDHLGSDPLIIKSAIEKAYSENGVLIFADLGSSILNSEIAIEFLGDNYNKEKVVIADAPIVEGLIIAVAMNDGKNTLSEITQELLELKSFKKI
ncbi:PTS-dependent dihydroxyacetone kinase phosphotransferase subunit DhaM [Cetobacterium sp. 2A]|uniref:dihydroxyacetone kinase phosphoryl donor subunit DhaM n=1 Tax=unclassified Cetobacterium TaxID=2630983 RepID=UPI00163BEE5C|nr:dihydroxyacetone kinase phosphoryl donor subunit DhaM [Cetobacterium sp. 2A]MBC2855213.1 PTS-dependent dihydroxyacetone kinase phosphotransferase subunit DhaM [Cetobacterium sp. 2A]